MRIVCPLLGQVPDAGKVSFASHFCSNSVNVILLAWSHGESGLALGSRLERERLGEKIGLKSKVENIGMGGLRSAKTSPKSRVPAQPEMP